MTQVVITALADRVAKASAIIRETNDAKDAEFRRLKFGRARWLDYEPGAEAEIKFALDNHPTQ